MAIQVRTLADLSDDYRRPDSTEGSIQPAPGVRVRGIREDRKAHWARQGLVPVVKGSGLVLNEELFETTADGVLREGKLELWAETEAHYRRRGGAVKEDAIDQLDIIRSQSSLRKDAYDAGVTLHDGSPSAPVSEAVQFSSGTVTSDGEVDAATPLPRGKAGRKREISISDREQSLMNRIAELEAEAAASASAGIQIPDGSGIPPEAPLSLG